MMDVGELIEKLKGYPPDLTVCVDGYVGGITEKHVTLIDTEVMVDVNEEYYYGEHEAAGERPWRDADATAERKRVLVISRYDEDASS